jgi:Protein of unknown function (DUF3667)
VRSVTFATPLLGRGAIWAFLSRRLGWGEVKKAIEFQLIQHDKVGLTLPDNDKFVHDSGVEHICKSCGNRFVGVYCNLCGEKIPYAKDRSFKTFLSTILIAVTFADSKLLKTLWLMIKNPGFISREFAEGRRVNYLKPLSVFFVLNLIYFLFPLIQLFSASLNTQLRAPHREIVQHIVASKMISTDINTVQAFSVIYNQKTEGLAKLLVMVFVVLASLPLNILYRKKNRYFIDHVGYQVEMACFNFGLGNFVDELSLTILFVATNLYFLIRSGITFYGERGWRLIVKSLMMIFVLRLALEGYRAVLFFVTIWSL